MAVVPRPRLRSVIFQPLPPRSATMEESKAQASISVSGPTSLPDHTTEEPTISPSNLSIAPRSPGRSTRRAASSILTASPSARSIAIKTDPGQVIWTTFSTDTLVAGQTVHGVVNIDLINAHHEGVEVVRVKVRGQAVSKARSSNGLGGQPHAKRRRLIQHDLLLWSKDRDVNQAPEDPDSTIISLPFSFPLPEDLPPSFYRPGPYTSGKIGYGMRVEAWRPGTFRSDRKLPIMFGVVPRGSKEMIELRNKLISEEGWTNENEWKTVATRQQSIKNGVFGGHSLASFELSLPAINAIPVGTPIPYILTITTLTKSLKHSQQPELPDPYNPNSKKSLFPSIAANSKAFALTLGRKVSIFCGETNAFKQELKDGVVAHLAGKFSPEQAAASPEREENAVPKDAKLEITTKDPEWVPEKRDGGEEKEGRGRYKREIKFRGYFEVHQPPNFHIENMACEYFIHVRVFLGKGNDLEHEFPLVFASGFDATQPDFLDSMAIPFNHETGDAHNSSSQPPILPLSPSTSPPIFSSMPPPDIEMPAAYFTDSNDWDYEERC